MVHFACDNKKTEDLLRSLYSIVKAEGGYIHDDVRFICRDGNLSVINAGRVKPRQTILTLPESATVRGQEFNLQFKDGKISILSYSDKVNAKEIEIVNIALDIYNENQKLSGHRKASVLQVFYQDPVLFRTVIGHYGDWSLFKDIGLKSEADFIGRNFMDLRLMEKSKPGKMPPGTKLLLPFIEYFNNHPKASSVQEYTDGKNSGFEVMASSPNETGDLFISYGPFDCYDLFVLQGYVESGTFFVRSRPMKIDVLDICSIEIDMQIAAPKYTDLPEELADIAYYLPRIRVSDDFKKIYFSHLLIPSRYAPQAMRRLLRFILGAHLKTGEEIHRAVLIAERQIIDRNLEFYDELTGQLQAYARSPATKQVIENLERVVELQVHKIEDYKGFMRL